MADLKFGSETPALGKIKVGGDNVSKIYKGSDQVWPSGPGSYLVQVCGSTTQTRVTAKKYWDIDSFGDPVLIDIPSIIPDNTVLKCSDDGKSSFCVKIISYSPSEQSENIFYLVNDIYSSCAECSPTPIGPSPGPSPGPQPSNAFQVQMCATGEEFFVDPINGYIGTTPELVSNYQLQIDDVLLVKINQSDLNPKCARIISTSNSGTVQRYFDFSNPAGPGCPGDPFATCID
jgi:hypothetical protein